MKPHGPHGHVREIAQCVDAHLHVLLGGPHQFAGVERLYLREDWLARFQRIREPMQMNSALARSERGPRGKRGRGGAHRVVDIRAAERADLCEVARTAWIERIETGAVACERIAPADDRGNRRAREKFGNFG